MSNEATLTALLQIRDQMSGGMQKVAQNVGKIEGAFKSLGTHASRAFTIVKVGAAAMGRAVLQTADQLDKMSKQTGINTTKLQKLSLAAKTAGGDLQDITVALRRLSQMASGAAAGNTEFIRAFRNIGMSVRDASGNLRSAEDLLGDFAEVLKRTTNPTERMALAQQFLGRSGAQLIPVLEQGREGLTGIGDAAERAGLIMSKDTVAALDKFGDQLDIAKEVMKNVMGTFLAETGITMPKITQAFISFAAGVQWWKAKILQGFEFVKGGVKVLVETLNIWFNAAVEVGKIAFAKLASTVEPFIGMITEAAAIMGLASQDQMDRLRNSLQNLSAEFGNKNLLQPFKDAANATGNAVARIGSEIDSNVQIIQRNFEETDQEIQQFGENLVKVMEGTAEAGKQVSTTTAMASRDIGTMSQSISGGLVLAIEDLGDRMLDFRGAWGSLFDSMQASMSNAIVSMIEGGKKWRDIYKQLFRDIKTAFIKMIADMAAQAIMKQIGGALGGLLGIGGTATVPSAGEGGGGGGQVPVARSASTFSLGNITQTGGIVEGDYSGVAGGVAGAAVGGITAYEGYQEGDSTQTTAGLAMAGASLGMMVAGPLGAVVGLAVGAIAGAVLGNRARRKARKAKKRAAAEAAAAQAAFEEQQRSEAARLIKMDVRNKLGGGLATEEAFGDVGQLMSGDISQEEIETFGGADEVVSHKEEIEAGATKNNYNVSNQITIHARIGGQYDVRRLAEQLGYEISGSIRGAVGGASPGV